MKYTLGTGFADEVARARGRNRQADFSGREETDFSGRILGTGAVLIVGFAVLFIRLFHLTVVKGWYYRDVSQGNRIRETRISSARGIIYDREGVPLVRNIPVFINREKDVFFEKPVSGSNITEGVAREYIYGSLLSHVIGYTGEIDREELESGYLDKDRYRMGDIIGKMGIEREYDGILSGSPGRELIEVDALENRVRTLGRIDPAPGRNIVLNIDLGIQQTVSQAMDGKKGAVVVSDPKNGEILSLYSSPGFDPNAFIRGGDLAAYFSDEGEPLFDRAISGTYPPGSVFKIVTAAASLEDGVISGDTKIEDTGVLKIGEFSFGNWYFTQYGRKEGFLDIVQALKRSNDIFFYKAGEMVGVSRLSYWARKLGIGKATGIDLDGEEAGLMPDPEWFEKTKGGKWYLGNTYNISIGQGDILVTPLQVNILTNIIASDGLYCKPRVFRHLTGASVESFRECVDMGLKSGTLELIKKGMQEACSEGGTAYPLIGFKVPGDHLTADGIDFIEAPVSTISAQRQIRVSLACKTGTAEFGHPKDKTHAWLTVFAPAHKPQISVAVLIEEGGEGSSVAAPVAKKILEHYFSGG